MKLYNRIGAVVIALALTGCTTVNSGIRSTNFRTKVVSEGCIVLTNNKQVVKRTSKDKTRYAYGKGENCPKLLPRSTTKILKVSEIRTQGSSALVVYRGKSGTQNILLERNTDPNSRSKFSVKVTK